MFSSFPAQKPDLFYSFFFLLSESLKPGPDCFLITLLPWQKFFLFHFPCRDLLPRQKIFPRLIKYSRSKTSSVSLPENCFWLLNTLLLPLYRDPFRKQRAFCFFQLKDSAVKPMLDLSILLTALLFSLHPGSSKKQTAFLPCRLKTPSAVKPCRISLLL